MSKAPIVGFRVVGQRHAEHADQRSGGGLAILPALNAAPLHEQHRGQSGPIVHQHYGSFVASKLVALASTRRALESIEESHDFFSGSEVALDGLRVEVLGLQAAFPGITQAQIAARFQTNPTARGTNAFNLVMRRDLDSLLLLQTQLRLTNLVAIYEGWGGAAAEELGLSDIDSERLGKFFQQGTPSETLASILGANAKDMDALRLACMSHVNFRETDLPKLRACYRAFPRPSDVSD